MVAPGDNSKKVELRIDMIFNADDLQRYDDLYKTPELFRGCKGKEHFEQFLELLALGFRLLLACDATAKHPKLFSEIVAGKEIGMNAVTTPATQNGRRRSIRPKIPPTTGPTMNPVLKVAPSQA